MITHEAWAAEIDRLLADTQTPTIPEPVGFTARQMAARPSFGRGVCTARRVIADLVAAGKVRAIGRRPGRSGETVYEIIS